MRSKLEPPLHCPGPAGNALIPLDFASDEHARSTVAFAIGGTTVTAGGLLAWFAFGTALTAFGTGALVAIGVLVILGVVAAIVLSAKGAI